MEKKNFSLKEESLDEAGVGRAVISTLDVVDKDGDVTLPDAFGSQPTVVLPTHDWQSIPLGKGTVREEGDEAVVDFKLNLESPTAKEWYSFFKFDMENGESLQEWSYGFDVLASSKGERDGKAVRFIEEVKVYEVSPVLVGAGINTRTVGIKSNGVKLEDQFKELEFLFAKVKDFSRRIKSLAKLRQDEGRQLSHTNIERLHWLNENLDFLQLEFNQLLSEPYHNEKAHNLYASFIEVMARSKGHLSKIKNNQE